MADPRSEPELVDPDGPTSIRPRVVPTILVVGCSRRFLLRCREAVTLLGIGVEECGVESYKALATRLWPPVIVMTEALFTFDPDAFGEIAAALGSQLVRVRSEDIATDKLNAELMQALFKVIPSLDPAGR